MIKQFTYVADFRYGDHKPPEGEISLNAIADQQGRTLNNLIWFVLFNNKHITKLHIISDYCSQQIEGILRYASSSNLKINYNEDGIPTSIEMSKPIAIQFDYRNTSCTSMKDYKRLSLDLYKEQRTESYNLMHLELLRELCDTDEALNKQIVINNLEKMITWYNESMLELNPDTYIVKSFYDPLFNKKTMQDFALDWAGAYDFIINDISSPNELMTITIQILWYLQNNIYPVLKYEEPETKARYTSTEPEKIFAKDKHGKYRLVRVENI